MILINRGGIRICTLKQNKNIFYDLHNIAIPLILSSISGILMGIIDQALVGRISIYAYAGVGLVTSSINSLIGIIGALSIAFNIIGSKYKGKNNLEELNNTFTIFIVINIIIGTTIFIVVNIWCGEILKIGFGLVGKTLLEAINFIRIFSFSILLNLLIFTYSCVFKIFRKTKHIFIINILVNIINIVLDYSLIFGKLGFPQMGSSGAALGTVIALSINLLIYIFASRNLISINFNIDSILSRIKKVLSFSSTFICQEFMEDIIFVIGINAIIARIGVIELSTYTLIIQIVNIVLMPMFGYTTANLSLISELSSQEDFKIFPVISKCTSIILVVLFIVFFSLILLFKNLIPSMITSDTALIESAKIYLPFAIFIQVFNYIMSVYKSSMQAIGFQIWTLKVTFIINVLTLILILFVGKGLLEIYVCIGLSYISNYILFFIRYKKICHYNL